MSRKESESAEWLIAHIILANVAFLQNDNNTAHSHIDEAIEIAEKLAQHGTDYNSPNISKFAKIVFSIEGKREQILFPIINGILISPILRLEELAGEDKKIAKAMKLKEVSISYFKLRFHIGELISALRDAKNADSSEQFAISMGNSMVESFKDEFKPDDLLDVANDNFMLARNMISTGNPPVAILALQNAERSLETYSKGDLDKSHRERVQKLKKEVGAITTAISRKSS